MNILTEKVVNHRTGRVEQAVSHVGCAECFRAVPVTALHYWRTDPETGRVDYFCSPSCSLENHERLRERHCVAA